MKKRIIISFCTIFISCIANGQIPSKLYTTPFSGLSSIAKVDYSTGKIITCSITAALEIHFAVTDLNNFQDIKVADNLIIKDFEIFDRKVFFCGQNLTNSGFLGWFDIDSLFTLNGSAHIDQTLSTLGLNTLENIEVFYEPGDEKIHIAGYGNGSASTYSGYLAFEAFGASLSSMQYRTLPLWLSGAYSQISDMAVTNSYVVYLEHSRDFSCYNHYGLGISLQAFPKYDMFTPPLLPPTFFQTVNITNIPPYVIPDEEDPHHLSSPMIVKKENDIVTVCSNRRKFQYSSTFTYSTPCGTPTPQNTDSYLVLRTFDLSPLSINNPIMMISADAAELYAGNVFNIKGFTYNDRLQVYYVLYQHESSSGTNEYAITFFDMSTFPHYAKSEYQSMYNTITEWTPNSICLFNTNSYLVSGYDNTSYFRHHVFWTNTITNWGIGNCATYIDNPVSTIPTQPHKIDYNLYSSSPWTPLIFLRMEHGFVERGICDILCSN